MTAVPLSAVNDAWHQLNESDRESVRSWVEQFRREQPVLSGFLLAAEENLSNHNERGSLLLMGLWAWLACRLSGVRSREISEEMIESVYDANEQQMRCLDAAGDADFMDEASNWTTTYPQMPLLGAMVNELMGGEMEETRRVDDMLGILILFLKTTIDCLTAE